MKRAIAIVLAINLAGCDGEVQRAVRNEMRDPDAAKFRNVWSCGASDTVWSGEVNGKNAFGAYVGFRKFFYADGRVEFLDDPNSAAGLIERCTAAIESSTAAMEAVSEKGRNPRP